MVSSLLDSLLMIESAVIYRTVVLIQQQHQAYTANESLAVQECQQKKSAVTRHC